MLFFLNMCLAIDMAVFSKLDTLLVSIALQKGNEN